jgi:carbon storage regulator
MLVLNRKLGETIVINERIEVTVVRIDRGTVRIGIKAPPEVSVLREELCVGAAANEGAATDRRRVELAARGSHAEFG